MRDAMYASSDAPPPTSIDVDALIGNERRRTRNLRLAGTAGGLALFVGLAATLPAYVMSDGAPLVMPGGSQSSPSCEQPSPTGPVVVYQSGSAWLHPTESCPQAIARLDEVLARLLAEVAPDAHPSPVKASGLPQFLNEPREVAGYEMGVMLTSARGSGPFSVHVSAGQVLHRTEADLRAQFNCGADPHCSSTTRPDGTVVLVLRGIANPANAAIQHQVEIIHPDGTEVQLFAGNKDPHTTNTDPAPNQPPLTPEQLVQLGIHPELTVFP